MGEIYFDQFEDLDPRWDEASPWARMVAAEGWAHPDPFEANPDFAALMPETAAAYASFARAMQEVNGDDPAAEEPWAPVHLALYRDGRNIMIGERGALSEEALRMIGGILEHASGLTGFGNSVASSYLRLVPHQEAPTRVCWGARNRSSLVRVPLSFDTEHRIDQVFNPCETGAFPGDVARPT